MYTRACTRVCIDAYIGYPQGLDRHGWQGVFVLAMETVGADSLNASVKAGRLVTLDSITRLVSMCGVNKIVYYIYYTL